MRERLENSLQILGVNADAVVAHGQHRFVAALFERDGDPAARLGVLGGILDQVADDLSQSARIATDVQRAAGRTSDTHVPSFFDEWLERVHRVSYDRGQIETFRPDLNQAVTDARQVQELVHESQECLRLGIDRLEQFDALRDPGGLSATGRWRV